MKKLKIILLFSFAVLFSPFLHAQYWNAADVTPVVNGNDTSSIDWTEQYVEAKGWSVIDTTRFPNYAQAMLMARRGAIVVAQRNLLEIIKGVRVVGETTVENMITTSDYVYSRVDGVIKGAEMVGEPRDMGGYIEVTMRVPLYEPNGVAAAVHSGLNRQTNALRGTATAQELATLPNMAFNISSGKNEAPNGNGNNQENNVVPADELPLFPVIVDENGNVLLDLSEYYDPNLGNFPQYLQLGRDVMEQLNLQQGVSVIDMVLNRPGQLQVNTGSNDRLQKWFGILKKVANIGQYVNMFVN